MRLMLILEKGRAKAPLGSLKKYGNLWFRKTHEGSGGWRLVSRGSGNASKKRAFTPTRYMKPVGPKDWSKKDRREKREEKMRKQGDR